MDYYFARLMQALAAFGGMNTEASDHLPKWRPDRRLEHPAEFFEATMARMEIPE
jgi:hypothetical protein